jgi:aminoglycoside phosphotransferase (APT) family kinase protein
MDGLPASCLYRRYNVMVLAESDVAPYLLRSGVLGVRAIVDGGLRVVDMSRRNRVFLVTADGEPGYVVKCPATAGDRGVTREAAVLDRLRSAGVTSFLPTPVKHDGSAGVLVLEAPAGAQDVSKRGLFTRTLARQAGRALAALHFVAPCVLDRLPAADPSRVLSVHQLDLDTMRSLSEASRELVRRIQLSDGLCSELEKLRASWHTNCVIHGDVRWDNWLAFGRGGAARRTRLMLIDWEDSTGGDPAMDIGAHLAEYLRAWRESAAREPGRVDPSVALPALQPAVAAFWEAYSLASGQDTIELSRTLRRAVRFAGARLCVAALEDAQLLTELPQHVLATLQLGANVLRRPDEAAVHLLGFRPLWNDP